MKVYISADMEGITGVAHWDEVSKEKGDYSQFQKQMTAEVVAACEGCLNAGATEIRIKDAHDTGRNIIGSELPNEAHLIRGWSGHPFSMMQDLDDSFHSVLMVGYHSRAGSPGSPLSHTMTSKADYLKINDRYVSEFLLNAYTSAFVGVPVIFLSGDQALCEDAKSLNKNIHTVAVKSGMGDSIVSIQPKDAIKQIREITEKAVCDDVSRCQISLPDHFLVEVRYHKHQSAYKASFFPNVKLIDPQTIQFATDEWSEVLQLIHFVL